MADYIDFVRISRDRRLDQLPVSNGIAELLKAIDRLALDMIAAGSPEAFVDDGQALVAEISIGTLAGAMRVHEATARRRLQAAAKTPYLEAHEVSGRPYMLCLNWREIPDREARGQAIPFSSNNGDHPLKGPADARGRTPLAKCEGSPARMQGVVSETARGSTPLSAETEGGSRYPSHFLSDCENQTNQLRALRDSDREHGGASTAEFCQGSQPRAGGFFEPALSDQLPWQRLEDEHLVTLEPSMLGVLYVEAIRSKRIRRDDHETRLRFLAVAFHCARHRKLDGMRAGTFAGRIRNGNLGRVMDQAWEWARREMDAGNHFGAGACLNSAVRMMIREDGR